MGKLVLGYWDVHGRGSPIRFLLEVAGADYQEEIYTVEGSDKWFKEKKESLGLLYPNLPYLIDQQNDGKTVKMTEFLPIMRYIARKHGLYPKTEEELVISDQTESFISDIYVRFIPVAYGALENYEKSMAEWLKMARQKLPYLNNLLAKNEYVTGKLSYVDILVYNFLLMFGTIEPKLLEENPHLARHVKTINALPQISNYRAGKGKGTWKERTFCAPFANWKGRM